MPPIIIVISIPLDLKKKLDQEISNIKKLLLILNNSPSDSVISKIKKAFTNKYTTIKQLISSLCEVYAIYGNFPTYTTPKLYPVLEQVARVKGIMNNPKLVPYKKFADKLISQKKSTEAVWKIILENFYSSITEYIQSISISMALISSIKEKLPDLLKYAQTLLSKINEIHEKPDTGPIHTKKRELQEYNQIRTEIVSIQTCLIQMQKELPSYSKFLSREINRTSQETGQLGDLITNLQTKITLSQAEKIVNSFKLRTNDYYKLSQTDNNPILSDISRRSDICLSTEEKLKSTKSPLVKQISDFTKYYSKNPSKPSPAQDKKTNEDLVKSHTLLDLGKNIPQTVSILDRTKLSITPLIEQFIGTKDGIIAVKEEMDQIHQRPDTGIIHTKAKEKVEYSKVNTLLSSLASRSDDNVRKIEDILNQTQQLKNNFASHINKINYLTAKQQTIKDLPQQTAATSKNIEDDRKKVLELSDKAQQLLIEYKKLQDEFNHFSTKKMIADYRSHYK